MLNKMKIKSKRKQLNDYIFQRSEKIKIEQKFDGHRSKIGKNKNKCQIEIGSVNWV
jgi:hypothetical protein